MNSNPTLSLYIHYPWCVKKCPYCDFNSHEIKQSRQNYVKTLLQDLNNDLAYSQGRSLNSIFIGGGTPSLLSVIELEQLLQGIAKVINFTPNIEITLEANPGTAEAQKFRRFRKIGINRLSIGVQSFDDSQLKKLGRIHNVNDAKQAILMAKNAGFDNFNLDLMYGLEAQTKTQALTDLQTAIDFNPSHLSYYQLTIEPNTYFAKYPPSLPNIETLDVIEQASKALLKQNNYWQYEVSAYSKFGKNPSKHNLNYWQFGDYLGIGAGAHSKITLNSGDIIRGIKPKSPNDYLTKPFGKYSKVTKQNLPFEFMVNVLRLKQGFSQDLFSQTTGINITQIEKTLTQAVELGLLIWQDNWIKPSHKGFNFLNDLQSLFL